MDESLADYLQRWPQEDLTNLGAILEMGKENPSAADIESTIRWLYHSRARAKVSAGIAETSDWIKSRLGKQKSKHSSAGEQYPPPSCNALITRLAKYLKVFEKDETVAVLEENISLEIIVRALGKMSPSQRRDYFNKPVDLSEQLDAAGITNRSLQGPMTTMATLAAAHASGFSVYIASTTALSFLTHAVGISLPFAAYTGLTSTIAFVIGPAGWLGVGLWAFWRMTEPEWKQLTTAIVYIIRKNNLDQLNARQ